MTIKAVIFDFDGLIIDTETPWYEAYKKVYQQYGVDLSLEIWGACVGSSFDEFDPHEYLEEQLGRSVDRKQVDKETRAEYDRFIKDQGVRPGVINYLKEAKQLGLSIGIASSSKRKWIEPYLDQYKLTEYFDTIVTADDVEKVKPDPELYNKAMNIFQVTGNETIVFEDSLNGLRAAKAAGAYCVIVPNRVTSIMPFEKYDMRLSSMDEIEFSNLLSIINEKSSNE